MNLLFENSPDYITVGGKKIKINTGFGEWVRFITACAKHDDAEIEKALVALFPEKIPDECAPEELADACLGWVSQGDQKAEKQGQPQKAASAFDFEADGNVLYCELWEYFPELMRRGITFHEGMELIGVLLSNENTMMWHRAFARCGNFGKMDKEQRKYWQTERAKYVIKAKQEDIDAVFANAF